MVFIPGHYNVDKNLISVSGLSSGAYFAVQFHVAFSKTIMGAGIIGGGRINFIPLVLYSILSSMTTDK